MVLEVLECRNGQLNSSLPGPSSENVPSTKERSHKSAKKDHKTESKVPNLETTLKPAIVLVETLKDDQLLLLQSKKPTLKSKAKSKAKSKKDSKKVTEKPEVVEKPKEPEPEVPEKMDWSFQSDDAPQEFSQIDYIEIMDDSENEQPKSQLFGNDDVVKLEPEEESDEEIDVVNFSDSFVIGQPEEELNQEEDENIVNISSDEEDLETTNRWKMRLSQNQDFIIKSELLESRDEDVKSSEEDMFQEDEEVVANQEQNLQKEKSRVKEREEQKEKEGHQIKEKVEHRQKDDKDEKRRRDEKDRRSKKERDEKKKEKSSRDEKERREKDLAKKTEDSKEKSRSKHVSRDRKSEKSDKKNHRDDKRRRSRSRSRSRKRDDRSKDRSHRSRSKSTKSSDHKNETYRGSRSEERDERSRDKDKNRGSKSKPHETSKLKTVDVQPGPSVQKKHARSLSLSSLKTEAKVTPKVPGTKKLSLGAPSKMNGANSTIVMKELKVSLEKLDLKVVPAPPNRLKLIEPLHLKPLSSTVQSKGLASSYNDLSKEELNKIRKEKLKELALLKKEEEIGKPEIKCMIKPKVKICSKSRNEMLSESMNLSAEKKAEVPVKKKPELLKSSYTIPFKVPTKSKDVTVPEVDRVRKHQVLANDSPVPLYSKRETVTNKVNGTVIPSPILKKKNDDAEKRPKKRVSFSQEVVERPQINGLTSFQERVRGFKSTRNDKPANRGPDSSKLAKKNKMEEFLLDIYRWNPRWLEVSFVGRTNA